MHVYIYIMYINANRYIGAGGPRALRAASMFSSESVSCQASMNLIVDTNVCVSIP